MKKKNNIEMPDDGVVFLGTAPDRDRRRIRLRLAFAALAVLVIAVMSFLLGRSTQSDFNPDLTVLPKKAVEKMVAPMLDSLVHEYLDVSETAKATVYRPSAKQIPVRIASCTVTENSATYRFEATESYGQYGTIQGELTLRGFPTSWDEKSGFLADASGSAVVGSGKVRKGSSSFRRLAGDIVNKIPVEGDEVALPAGKMVLAAIGRTTSGEYFIIEGKSLMSYSDMSDILKTAGAEYAIFINGHLAYNWRVENDGIKIMFASYTDKKPKGMSLRLW